MLSKRLLRHSLESVAHQPDPRFFRELVEAFTELGESDHPFSDAKRDQSVIKASGVERIVKRYTGVSVNLRIGRQMGINAFVMPPTLDRNHPLLNSMRRTFTTNKDAIKSIEKAKGAIEGSIDLEVGRVEGVFTTIRSDIFVAGQIIQDGQFTPEEATAIFLHELGHLMTYYEYLGRNFMLNHVMGDLTRGYAEATSQKERVRLIEVTAEALDIHGLDAQHAAEIKDAEIVQQVIVSEVVNKPESASNTRVYDYRTWEALADQYVSRMGAGRHLATGLDRLMRMSGHHAYRSNVKYLIIESAKILVLTSKWLITTFVLLTIMNGLSEPQDLYDPPYQRLARIRRDLVDAMKNPRIDKEYRRRLQEDADVIADLLKNVKDRETVIGFLWKRLYPPNLKQMNRVKVMQQLETLANNELFVKANQLTVQSEGETHA